MSIELIANIRAAVDQDDRRSNAWPTLRRILDVWAVDHHGDLTAQIPGEYVCDDQCVRVIGEHTLAIIAEGYGIEVPEHG